MAFTASNALFAADWQDAQEIDLSDPVLLEALAAGTFTADDIENIKAALG